MDTRKYAARRTWDFCSENWQLAVRSLNGENQREVVVDAPSGRSGNDGRDRKMHKDVLESARFGEITFRPDRIIGKLEMQGDSVLQVYGVFLLHGNEHELTVPAEANLSGDHWNASAKFSIPFIEWGSRIQARGCLKWTARFPSSWSSKAQFSPQGTQ